MATENYDELFEIVERKIAEARQNNKFKFSRFLYDMEQGFTAHGFRESDESNSGIDNILVFRLDAVGDFILSTPAIRELRMNYPFANITLVVNKRVYRLAERCPYVNEVLPIDMNFNRSSILETVQIMAEFAKKYLWHRHFKLAFSLNNWAYTDAMMLIYLSGAKERIGYAEAAFRMFKDYELPRGKSVTRLIFTHPVLKDNRILHMVSMTLYILRSCALQVRNTQTEVWFDYEDVLNAKRLLKDFAPNKTKVIIGIGAGTPERKYPVEKYLQAFKKIVDRGAALIIIGGSSEAEDAKFLQDNLPADSVKNLVEFQTDWRTNCAVMAQADMYLANDTGLMHAAAALHLPIVYLSRTSKDRKQVFENVITDIDMCFPWQTKTIMLQPEHQLGDCAKTFSWEGCSARKPHCITQIEPDEIVAAYDKMIEFIKSDIKEIGSSAVVRGVNQNLQLYNETVLNK